MTHRRYSDDADFEDIVEHLRDRDDVFARSERLYERQYVPTAEDVGAERWDR